MKRVIKYFNKYESDGAKFSDCSTKYEVLPIIVEDDAGEEKLREIAKQLGLVRRFKVETHEKTHGRYGRHAITHSLRLQGKVSTHDGVYFHGKDVKVNQYLGFITISGDGPEIKESVENKLDSEQCYEIVNNQECGVDNVIELDGSTTVVMSGWHYYHALAFRGYSRKSFEKIQKVKERVFEDSISSCEECGEYDYTDNGYNYNFRSAGGDYGHYGVNCGCWQEQCEKNLEKFTNDEDKALEEEIVELLEKKNKIECVDEEIRFTGDRAETLQTALKKFPGSKFVFGESYRSVSLYRVAGKPKVIRVV